MAPGRLRSHPAVSGEAGLKSPLPSLQGITAKQGRRDTFSVTVKPENGASVSLAEEGIRSYLVKEGGRGKRAGLVRSDPVSEIPCCGTPDRRQLKAIRIQLPSGCTVQQQQPRCDSFKLNITCLPGLALCICHSRHNCIVWGLSRCL